MLEYFWGIISTVFALICLFIIIKASWEPKNKVNLNDFKFMNKETSTNFQVAADMEVFKNTIITDYYNLESEINIRAFFKISVEEVIKILENKKVFIFNNSMQCTTLQVDITDVSIKISHSQGFKVFRAILVPTLIGKLNSQDIEVYEKIKKISSNIIKPKMSDFEKERAVHDYLILTSRYDEENYKNNTIPDVSHTPYGLLFKNKAVCSAYAEVFMIFMTLANIECYYVIGSVKESRSNMGHAWNIVRIENKYYHIDVTFDNPGPNIIGQVYYKYFNVTDKTISKTHIWNREDYPSCTSSEHNYYNFISRSRN